MFENISSTLQQCGVFFIAGVIMGLFYEVFRTLRIAVRHHAVVVFIEDILFFSLCGAASFIIALTVGIGYFRIYYAVFEVLGAGIYFLTLGRLINMLLKKIIKWVKRFFYAVYKKISPKVEKVFVNCAKKSKEAFVKIAEIVPKPAFVHKKDLPNANEMVYNIKTPSNEGGSGNAIRAKIRR